MEREYLTVSEVCGKLGLSDSGVKLFIAKGLLRATRPGGKKLLIKKTDLDQFLENGVVKPKAV